MQTQIMLQDEAGKDIGILFRKYDKDSSDENFVKSTWINSFRLSPHAGGVNLNEKGKVVNVHTNYVKGKSFKVLHSQMHEDHIGNPANPDSGKLSKGRKRIAMAISDTVYFYEQRDLISTLIDSEVAAQCWIACDPNNHETCYGWICFDMIDGVPVVHYVYVKKLYQKAGLAKAMMRAVGVKKGEPCFFTHEPPSIFKNDAVIASRWKSEWVDNAKWTYNPYVLTRYYEKLARKFVVTDPAAEALAAALEKMK